MTNLRILFIAATISLSSAIFASKARFDYPTPLQSIGCMLMAQAGLLKTFSKALVNNGYANIELPKGPSVLKNVANIQKFSRASFGVGLFAVISPFVFKAAEQLGMLYRK